MSMLVPAVTPGSFDTTVLNSADLTVVKIWADWCVPCKAVGPKVDRLAATYNGRVRFVSLDAQLDINFVKTQLKVASIPALLVYQGGALRASYFGPDCVKMLEDYLTHNLDKVEIKIEFAQQS